MKAFWVSCDSDGDYCVHKKEPSPGDWGKWARYSHYISMELSCCKGRFERITGMKLKPKQFVKVTLQEVSDIYYYD